MVGCGLGLVLLLGGIAFHHALHYVPAAYQRALQVDPEAQRHAGEVMLQKVTALRSDARKQGPWQALFSEAQINAWLAGEVAQNHPEAIPPEIHDPRVLITPPEVTVAFRFTNSSWDTVVTLTVEPSVPEPNVLALRFGKLRAGAVPLPMSQILEQVSQAARRQDLQVEWRQADGDPVALLHFPPPRDGDRRAVTLESLRLGPGELLVSGTTKKRP